MTKLTLLGRVEDCERDRRRRGALTQDVAAVARLLRRGQAFNQHR